MLPIVSPASTTGPVTDIVLWVECYSSLVAVLAKKHPQHIADFMAYQRSIIKASRNFDGAAWVVYDRCYRRRAAATKSLEWAKIDSALYNEAFTGRARSIPRCQFCLSETHGEAECPSRLPTYGYEIPTGPRAWSPNLVGTSLRGSRVSSPYSGRPVSNEVCQLFNRVSCRAQWCRRRHVCNVCCLPHPEVVCPNRAGQRGSSNLPHRR